jgi:hypothetical protein
VECLNLKRRFGQRSRVTYKESYRAEHGPAARVEDPWLMIIPCKYGHLFPWDTTTLAASVDGHPSVAGRLRRLPCCRVHQDGDFGELTVLFNADDFPKVAQIMRPRRRRQARLTREQRQEIGRRLREGRKRASHPVAQGQSTADRGGSKAQGDAETRPATTAPVWRLSYT